MKKDKYFRYLEKYVGTYCVRAELDPDTNDFPKDPDGKLFDSFEDFYIKCKRGIIKHTYEKGILALYFLNGIGQKNGVEEDFKANGIWYKDESVGSDGLLYFKEEDMKKVAKIVVPRTTGNKIPPLSKRALPKSNKNHFEIPEEELKRYKEITDKITLEHMQKVQLMRKLSRDFEEIAQKKVKNIKEIKKENKFSSKDLFYYTNLWDDYLAFIQSHI